MENFGQKKNRQKLKSEKTRVYAQKSWLKMLFKNSISGGVCWEYGKAYAYRPLEIDLQEKFLFISYR
jgi:hypothetical protein